MISYEMNNYIVRSYRDVIVITKFAITKFAWHLLSYRNIGNAWIESMFYNYLIVSVQGPLCNCVCTINNYSTLLNIRIVRLLILFIFTFIFLFILFSNAFAF